MSTVLQFGGGKDSLACLYLLKPRWQEIIVAWMNTGAAFPESIELMNSVRKMVPNFVEINSDVLSDIKEFGWPVDVLPVKNMPIGAGIVGGDELKLRPWVHCCASNIWFPMAEAMKRLGATTVIRGQRQQERYKGQLRSGDVVDGIRYEYPIESWSEEDVFAFLKKEGVEIPAYYKYTGTSLDCWNCTAFLDAKLGQLKYMKEKHPEKHSVVIGMLNKIAEATAKELIPLEKATRNN